MKVLEARGSDFLPEVSLPFFLCLCLPEVPLEASTWRDPAPTAPPHLSAGLTKNRLHSADEQTHDIIGAGVMFLLLGIFPNVVRTF